MGGLVKGQGGGGDLFFVDGCSDICGVGGEQHELDNGAVNL